MSEDARFEDGAESALNLGAMDADDLRIISALAQDAVFPRSEMRWFSSHRRFALLLNRYRWEDSGQDRHLPERVQSVLAFDNVMKVASQGLSDSSGDTVLSLLAVDFHPGEDGAGEVLLTLAGDGALRLSVEALEVRLRDVTRPYVAPSRKRPQHDI